MEGAVAKFNFYIPNNNLLNEHNEGEEYVLAKDFVLLSDGSKSYGDDVFYGGPRRIYKGGPWNSVEYAIFNSSDNAKAYRKGSDGYPQNAKAEVRELVIASTLGGIAATDYLKNEEDRLKKNLSDNPIIAEQKWNEAISLGRQIAKGIYRRYIEKLQQEADYIQRIEQCAKEAMAGLDSFIQESIAEDEKSMASHSTEEK